MLQQLCLIALTATCALAAAPTPWSQKLSVFVDDKLPASQWMKNDMAQQVGIPELAGDLQIELNNHKLVGFKVCLKQNVAAPSAAGMQNWDNPLFCELFHFTNGTKASTLKWNVGAAAQRLRSVNARLRGFGSVASDVSGSVASSVSAGRELSRRSVSSTAPSGEGYIQMKNVRAGMYYVTVAATSKQSKNMTLSMTMSGTKCPNAGENPMNNCKAFPSVSNGQSLELKKMAPKAMATAQFADWNTITANTGSVTIMANLYESSNSSATVLARYGAPPTMDVYDAKLDLTEGKGNDGKSEMGTIASPAKAPWYVSVINGNMTTASVNVTVVLKQCDAKKFGKGCAATAKMLGKAGALDSMEEAKKDQPIYVMYKKNDTASMFDLLNANNTALAVAAAALNPDDKRPQVYARYGLFPSTTEFDLVDCSVMSCPKDQSTLIVGTDDVAATGDAWYVMIVPQTDNGVGVWNAEGGKCANDCGGNGNCTVATATCTCAADFTSFDCATAKDKLERWEWALIIGGGVLVAIGLIGCIVFFIQKQQRRAGFERV